MLEQQPQPVTTLFEMCQKDGHQVDIKSGRKSDKNVASVYIDGNFIISASSDQKDNAKLQAAEAALEILAQNNVKMNICTDMDENFEVEAAAKKKLHEVCVKKKWSKPRYRYKILFFVTYECFNILYDCHKLFLTPQLQYCILQKTNWTT